MTMSNGRAVSINPDGMPKPIRGYYSNSVRVQSGPLLFIAGQISVDDAGNVIGKDDVVAQAEQIFKNLSVILAASGGGLSDIVKITVYLADIDDLDRIAPVRLRHFPSNGPASVLVEV
jgi:2-iminobutanoate/2-iminopropanoate deaminase